MAEDTTTSSPEAETRPGEGEQATEVQVPVSPTSDHATGLDEAKENPPRSSSKPSLSLDTDGPLQPTHLDHHPADDLHGPESPTTTLIESLRTQLSILSDQSVQLNTKLIASISRHADLEDQHFQLQEQHKLLGERAEGLERDKRQYEESMQTGLLVERAQISAEMQKLAAGLVEEERKRGSAEERRKQVENEVDDLSASLFDQANTMVAQERHGRIEAEERLKSAEENLAVAEAAVRDMQLHLQSMPTSSRSPPSAPPSSTSIPRRYLASHVPYAEYLSFLAHLRALRPLKETSKNLFPPPLIVNLLAQPFLARISAEDHDSTLRLDIAPDISWLSRKGVNQAVIAGELIIEPVGASTVIANSSSAPQDIGCSLCGKPVFPATLPPGSPIASHFGPPPAHPTQRAASSSRFSLKPFFNSTSPNPTHTGSPTSSPLASPGIGPTMPAMASLGSVYIFRVNKPPPANGAAPENPRLYPLCKTGWCLERLRATCELWHFVRTGIVHVVWHGDDGYILPSEGNGGSIGNGPTDPHTPTINGSGNANASGAERSTPTITGAAAVSEAEGAGAGSAPEMNRKKSAWGLGFKLADKAPSGWAKAWNRTSAGSTNLATGAGVAAGVKSPQGSPRRMPPAPGEPERKASESSISEEKEPEAEAEPAAAETSTVGEGKAESEKGTDGVEESTDDGKAKLEAENTDAPVASPNAARAADETPNVAEEPTADQSTAEDDGDDLLASLQAQLEASSPPRQKPKRLELDAPLELDSDLPQISETAPTPSAPGADTIPAPATADGDLPRNESGTSLRSSGSDADGEQFTTPKEEHHGLVPESLAPIGGAGDREGKDAGEEEVNATPKKPPVPKRSAGRTPRPDANGNGGNTPAEGSRSASPAPAAPTAETVTRSPPPPLPDRRLTQPPTPRDAAGPSATSGEKEGREEQPPLPPRHPRTPNAQLSVTQTMAPDGEKAFLRDDPNADSNGESWEVKTWKAVIRLKEEMWKKRIGVVDEAE